MPDLPDEKWLPLPGYETLYEISNMGRVKSLGRISKRRNGTTCTCHARILKPGQSKKSKYWSIRMSGLDEVTTWYVHHLVLTTFVGPMPDGMEACHGDGDRSNNRLTNLRWDTRLGNASDRYKHGTSPLGNAHPMAKLTDDIVRKMRERRAEGASATTLSCEFNVSRMTAFRAATGRSWSHLK